MSETRIVNTSIFREQLEKKGRNGLAVLSVESGLSPSTLEKIKRGYVPSGPTRRLISLIVKISEDELFPLIGTQAA